MKHHEKLLVLSVGPPGKAEGNNSEATQENKLSGFILAGIGCLCVISSLGKTLLKGDSGRMKVTISILITFQ